MYIQCNVAKHTNLSVNHSVSSVLSKDMFRNKHLVYTNLLLYKSFEHVSSSQNNHLNQTWGIT